MNKNFKIGQSNELIQDDESFDLHNCYDFVKVILEEEKVLLFFEANSEYGKGLPSIRIKFVDVSYFSASPDFDKFGVFDLDEMGYKNPSDFDDKWLLNEEQANTGDHILFRFIGGQFIRVFSSKAELTKLTNKERLNEPSI